MKRAIGNTGVTVNAIGLGEWPLSNAGRPPEAKSVALIRRAVEAGVELIDTADAYARDDGEFGHGERLVREALAGFEAGRSVRVATKVGFRRPGGQWVADARPERTRACCEASLERLGVDTIFLYQLHTPDPAVPLEESVGALAELKREGKIEHIGLSNVGVGELERAQSVARIESVQNECNPWTRDDLENGLVERCRRDRIAYLPYRPVGGKDGHRRLAADATVRALADKYGVSPYRVLLAWLLALGEHVIPIPGATRVESVLDNLAATTVRLAPQDIGLIRDS